ncbi:MAG TPA: ATP-binding protein, partial [Chloroflexota bacterium]|nr:ATP-binding protein [Chloroflexota bacterium]
MLRSVHGHLALKSPEAREQLLQMRTDALRFYWILTLVGYVGWNLLGMVFSPSEEMIRQIFIMAPPAIATLVGTSWLLDRDLRAAYVVFLGGGMLAVTWAIFTLGAPYIFLLLVILALVAAFVIHPLGGFLVVGTSTGLLCGIRIVRPDLVTPGEIVATLVFGIIAVIGVWSLSFHLFQALNWYVASYSEAERQTRDAREHRAQLVQALKQLDNAYYRIERANAALQLAWKSADEAERSKTELATNISHELRTPLNLITGYSELMMTSPASYQGTVLPAAYRGDVNAIYRSAQHLLALADDVLDLAQMEVGRLGLTREPVDLAQVVRDAASLIREYIEAKGLSLVVAVPAAVPTVIADRLRVRQVLINLLTNAARFTESGSVELAVTVRESDLYVQVTDSGPGIQPDALPRVFEQFVTRDRQRAGWHSGTGLGLPISKRFVELHGGEMGVESVVGQGTTFWFSLPLLRSADEEPPTLETLHHQNYRGQPEQIIVLAHADLALARLLQRHLGGFRIEVASDLADAVSRARNLRAVAVLADLESAAAPDCDVPVIYCPLPRTEHLVRRLGVADYLVKPVSRDTLLSAIHRLGVPVASILIVDNDDRFTRLLARMLLSGRPDCRVTTVYNGDDALDALRSARPDLLLLDLAMPGMGGLDVLERMVEDPALANVKVIVISAQGESDGRVWLGTEIRFDKPEGFHLAETFELVGAALTKLSPSRANLPATASERRA